MFKIKKKKVSKIRNKIEKKSKKLSKKYLYCQVLKYISKNENIKLDKR